MQGFFKKQETDETGKLAVRVQRTLIVLFVSFLTITHCLLVSFRLMMLLLFA